MEFSQGLVESAVRIAIPILWLVLGEIVSERAGVLNIGLEGMLLVGAFGAFAGAVAFGAPAAAVGVAVLASVALAALFAALVLRGGLDPIVTGVAINVLALGLTGVLYRAMLPATGETLFADPLPVLEIPGLSALPLVGSALFAQNVLGYGALVLTFAVAWFLHRTTPGLVVRATGENPDAVETSGQSAVRVRWLATLFGGVTAGLAGAYLAIGYSNTFVEGMSAGRGFVALAIVVFARWRPARGLFGALLFGLAMSLQVRLQGRAVVGIEIPYQFFQMLPYVLTLVVLATAAPRGGRAPAALAQPLRRDR